MVVPVLRLPTSPVTLIFDFTSPEAKDMLYSLPPRFTRTSSLLESALTTETPTPDVTQPGAEEALSSLQAKSEEQQYAEPSLVDQFSGDLGTEEADIYKPMPTTEATPADITQPSASEAKLQKHRVLPK